MDAAALQVANARSIVINMAGIQALDTLGAWLLERLIRSWRERGHDAAFTSLPEHYRGLLDEVRRPEPAGASVARAAQSHHRRARKPRAHDGGLQGRYACIPRDARRPRRRARSRARPPARLSAHLGRASSQSRRLAGDAHHPADHLPDRLHHRAARLLPFPQVRRGCLRGRHGRHPGGARDRRADRHDHGRRPLRQRLHRRARLDEDARGNRRAAHHGVRSGRSADPAARARAGLSRCRS